MNGSTPIDTDLLYATCSPAGVLLHRDPAWTDLFGDTAEPWSQLPEQDHAQIDRCVQDAAAGILVTHQLVTLEVPDRTEPLPILLNFLPAHHQQTDRRRPVDVIVVTGEVLAEPTSWTQSQTQRNRFETLGRMTMGIAHDFNNLLSGILGYTELLKSAATTEPPPQLSPKSSLFDHLRTVEKAALDGAALVNKIQQYIRQEKQTRFEPLNVAEIVRDCISLTRPYWYNEPRRNGINISVVLEADDAPHVLGSATELREVFVNLILNAVQAMPNGGHIRIHLYHDDDRGVVITVSDSGTGMREDVRTKAFEPLFTTKGERGTGMGLAVTHGIIQEHEGTVALESEWGHGTTFTITMPPADEASPAALTPAQVPTIASARILVVDDEHMVRSVLEKLLTLKGHTVRQAASGEEALEIIEEESFDIVFTDHGMPHMGGRELAERVRTDYPDIPLVLLTGDTEVEEAGAFVDRVMSKPFQIDDLQTAIQDLVRDA